MSPRRRAPRGTPVRSRSEWRAFVQRAIACAKAAAAADGAVDRDQLMQLHDAALGALPGLFVQGCGMAGAETGSAFIAIAKWFSIAGTAPAARALMAPSLEALARSCDGFLDILQAQAAGAERGRVDIYG